MVTKLFAVNKKMKKIIEKKNYIAQHYLDTFYVRHGKLLHQMLQ